MPQRNMHYLWTTRKGAQATEHVSCVGPLDTHLSSQHQLDVGPLEPHSLHYHPVNGVFTNMASSDLRPSLRASAKREASFY